jgi:N-acetylmuramoyl-L-alanine amidase
MIVVLRKSNLVFVAMIFVLSLILYGLNAALVSGRTASNYTNEDYTEVSKDFGKGKVVVLDPGHGGEDPGAVSDNLGLKEKDINLYVALKVKKLLEESQYKVIMTRTEDILEYDETAKSNTDKRRQDLKRRKKIMDESNADIVVSIHMNKFDNPKYYGAQAFFAKNSKSSQKLAICLQASLIENLDKTNKREALLKKEEIIILKDMKVTTAIIECGFLSNPDEEKKLADDKYKDQIARAIKIGIDNYFKV